MKLGLPLAALALAALLVVAPAPARAGDGKAALRLLPVDTALVITVNVDRTRRSKTGKRLLAAMLGAEKIAAAAAKLRDKAGVDLARDVTTVVIGMADDFDKSEHIALVVEGRLAPDKLVAAARSESSGFESHKHRGVAYHVVDDDSALAFLGSRLVLAPKDWMPAIIDVHRGRAKSVTRNRPLMALIRSGDTGKDLWAALLLPKPLREEVGRETGGHSVDSLVTSVDTANGLAIRVHGDMSTPEAASAIGSLLTLSRPQLAKEPKIAELGLSEAFRTMVVKADGKSLDAELTASPADLTALEKKLESLKP